LNFFLSTSFYYSLETSFSSDEETSVVFTASLLVYASACLSGTACNLTVPPLFLV